MLWAVLIGLLSLAVGSYRGATILQGDSVLYLRARPVFKPYHLRWLLPALLGHSIARWHVVTSLSVITSSVLVYLFTHSLVAVWLWSWLWLVQNGCSRPCLVDITAVCLALGATLAAQAGLWWLAIPLTLLAGATKETAPVFAAAWCFEPVLLVGVLACGWFIKPAMNVNKHVQRPFWNAWLSHDPLSFGKMLLPWGALLVLVPLGNAWDRQALIGAVSLLLGYGQLIRASDGPRLYLWAAPALLPIALNADVGPFLPLLLLAHPFLCPAEDRKIQSMRIGLDLERHQKGRKIKAFAGPEGDSLVMAFQSGNKYVVRVKEGTYVEADQGKIDRQTGEEAPEEQGRAVHSVNQRRGKEAGCCRSGDGSRSAENCTEDGNCATVQMQRR